MSGIDDENPFGVSHLVMSYHVIHQFLILKEKSVEDILIFLLKVQIQEMISNLNENTNEACEI